MAGSVRQVAVEYVGRASGLTKATQQAEKALGGFADTASAEGKRAGTELESRFRSGALSAGSTGGKAAASGLSQGMNGAGTQAAGQVIDELETGLEKGSKSAAKGFTDNIGPALLGGGLAVAGAKAGSALLGGVLAGAEKEKGADKLAAQINLSPKESAKVGRVAGKLYAGAWGDSMEDVNGAVAAVRSNIAGMDKASGRTLQARTANALDFATAMEVDVGEAAVSAGALVNTGLARNAKQAFDLMTAGAQAAGPQMTQPLLDATNEYSKHFAMLGFDGKGAMATLASAASGGEIAIDKAGDAIKEFGIRATDLNDTGAQESLGKLGLNGREVANALLAGGKQAEDATSRIAAGLLKVQDPAKRAALAGGLFGTQIEDIGKDNIPGFLKALTGADTGLGKVAGRADRMGKTLNDNAATNLESFKRQAQQTFVNVMGSRVVPILSKGASILANDFAPAVKAGWAWLQKWEPVISPIATGLGILAVGLGAVMVQQSALTASGALTWFKNLAGVTRVVTAAQWAWNAATAANPVGIVILAVAAVAAAIGGLIVAYKRSERFREIVQGAFSGIQRAASAVASFFTDRVLPVFRTIGDIAKKLFTGDLSGAVAGVSGLVQRATSAISSGAQSFVASMGERGKEMISRLISGAVTAVPRLVEWAKSLPSRIGGAVDGIGTWLQKKGPGIMRGLANGLKKAIPIVLGIVIGIPLLLAAAVVGGAALLAYAGASLIVALGKSIGKAIGRRLLPVFQGLVGWLAKKWQSVTGAITRPFKRASSWLSNSWRKGFSAVSGWLSKPVEAGRDRAGKAVGRVRSGLSNMKSWAGSTWKKGWSAAKGWIGDAVEGGKDRAQDALDRTKRGFQRLGGWGKTGFRVAWSEAKAWIADPVGKGKELVGKYQDGTRDALNGLDTFGRKVFGPKWSGMKDKLASPIQTAKDALGKILGRGGSLRTLFSGAVDAIGKIWSKLKKPLLAPARFLLDTVINKGIIAGVNKIASFVGADKLDTVDLPKMAGGGILPGQSSWRSGDDQLIGARRGEGVTMSEPLRDPYERARLLGLNAAAKAGRTAAQFRSQFEGHALGGLVGGSGRFSPLATKTLLKAQQMAGVPFSIFQRGFRPATSYSGSSHQGDAIDTGPVTARVVAALRSSGWAAWDRTGKGNWVPHIHAVPLPGAGYAAGTGDDQARDYLRGGDGLGGRDTGPRGMLGQVRQWLKSGVGAVKGLGGSLAGGLGQMLPNVKDLIGGAVSRAMEGYKKFAGSPWGQILSKLPPKLAGMAMDWGRDKLSALGAMGGPLAGNYGGSQMGIAKTIVETARNLGFGQRGAIIGLITGIVESGLRNLPYGDRDSLGVFQQRGPWGSAADRMNPAKAARMFYLGSNGNEGLRDKAWRTTGMGDVAQQVQVSGHPERYATRIGEAQTILSKIGNLKPLNRDSGGPIPTGLSLLQNNTGRQEQAVTGSQWDAITQGTTKIELSVTVQGGVVDDRTADRIAEALERRLRRKGPTRIGGRR